MQKLTVRGAGPLYGKIKISGSKNEALPIIFSCILMHGKSEISNLPDISDVRVALEIIKLFGAVVERRGDGLIIDTECLRYAEVPSYLTSSLRASTYLIGSMLARFGKCPISGFGGCSFAPRPIDMHILALRRLGGRVEGDFATADGLCGADIYFDKRSVGATVNALLLSATAKGRTRIFGYARETHILNLIAFLNSAGARIIRDEEKITVYGTRLGSGKIKIAPDIIEGATYLNMSVMTGGNIYLSGVSKVDFSMLSTPYASLGISLFESFEGVYASRVSEGCRVSLIAEPEPGFPTDLQPIFAPLLSSVRGGFIEDRVFPERFGYLKELSKFGVRSVGDRKRVEILKSSLFSAKARALDLRCGIAELLCAVCCEGESEIESAELILRGYDRLTEKLSSLSLPVSLY